MVTVVFDNNNIVVEKRVAGVYSTLSTTPITFVTDVELVVRKIDSEYFIF